ncbi:MAG: ABC transporter permease [Muribaculum sp.]|nr:ABC transporter permease [Muribaculum sp.]
MNYSFFLARRLSASAGRRKTSPAVRVATVAVALSVVVMLAAIAIVTGFKQQIVSKLEGFNANINVTVASGTDASEGSNLISLSPSLKSILDSNPAIADYSIQITAPAILKTPSDFKGVYMKTLAGSYITDLLSASMEEGSLPEFALHPDGEIKEDSLANRVVISRVAADKLGLHAGDRVDVYFMTDQIRVRRMRITGIYNSHFDSYDDLYIFGSPKTLSEIGGLGPNQGTSLSIRTLPTVNDEEVATDLQHDLIEAYASGLVYRPYRVESLRQTSGNYFSWLDLLDMNVVIILTLMTFVSCVTLISGMLIIIVDKKRFIALMKSLGAPAARLRRVFVYLALRVALLGLIVGDVIGIGLLWVQKATHFVPLDPDAYYIDFVPVEISWPAVVALNAGVLLISYFVLILPSRFIASVSPARVLSRE